MRLLKRIRLILMVCGVINSQVDASDFSAFEAKEGWKRIEEVSGSDCRSTGEMDSNSLTCFRQRFTG
jgi:hypothetical protein